MLSKCKCTYHRVHGAELAEVILVGRVVAVPRHYIERREGLGSREELALILLHDQVVTAFVLIPGHWRLKVARICQPIAACTSMKVLEGVGLVVLRDVG